MHAIAFHDQSGETRPTPVEIKEGLGLEVSRPTWAQNHLLIHRLRHGMARLVADVVNRRDVARLHWACEVQE
jgi:hypothetical protein